MTVDELIKALQDISDRGHGAVEVRTGMNSLSFPDPVYFPYYSDNPRAENLRPLVII